MGICQINLPRNAFCAGTTLNVGASGTITLIATLSPSAPNGVTVTNTAFITSSEDLTGTSASAQVQFSNISNVDISKFHIPATLVAGTPMTYVVVMTNTTGVPATNVTMRDTLPAIGTVTSVSHSANVNSCLAGAERVCTIASFAANATAVVTFGIDINSSIADNFTITNTASVTSSQSVLGDSFTDVTAVQRLVTLLYTQDDSTSTPVAGTLLTYTVSITNSGPSDATNVTISDTMPVSGTLDGSSDPSCQPGAGPRDVTCFIAGPLALNGSLSVPIVVMIDQATANRAVITNTVRVTSTEYTSGPSIVITETVQKQVSLAVSKSQDIDPAVAGAPLTYTMFIVNSGPSQASGVKLTDTLPVSTTFTPVGSSPYCASSHLAILWHATSALWMATHWLRPRLSSSRTRQSLRVRSSPTPSW